MQLLYQQVYIVTAPIAAVGPTLTLAVFLPRCIVGEVYAGHRIWIEVVVHMDGIHFIPADDVAHHFIDKVSTLGQCRVKINLAISIFHKPFRVLVIHVAFGGLVGLAAGHTVGVYPCMKLHASLMAFVNHKLQRIPHRIGSHARCAGNPLAPRLYLARISSIRLRTNLPNHGIHATCL